MFTGATLQNVQNDRRSSHIRQPRRHRDKTPAHTVTDGISRRVTSDWHYTSVIYLSVTEWRLVRSISRNVLLLQQFLPAIRQISSDICKWHINRRIIPPRQTAKPLVDCDGKPAWSCSIGSHRFWSQYLFSFVGIILLFCQLSYSSNFFREILISKWLYSRSFLL